MGQSLLAHRPKVLIYPIIEAIDINIINWSYMCTANLGNINLLRALTCNLWMGQISASYYERMRQRSSRPHRMGGVRPTGGIPPTGGFWGGRQSSQIVAPVKLRTRATPPTGPAKHSSPVRAPERLSTPTAARPATPERNPPNLKPKLENTIKQNYFKIGMNLARVGIWRRIELTPVMSVAVFTM